MDSRKVVQVSIGGRKRNIPDYWFVGYCRNGHAVLDAAIYWHEQPVVMDRWDIEGH